MKRFIFSLEKVLILRKYSEEESKINLGKAISVLNEIENNIKTSALSRHNAMKERFSDTENTHDMIAWDNYIVRMDQTIEKLTNEAAKAEMEVEEKRELYLKASRELKVIEKLKEKREKEYRKEMFKAEAMVADSLPMRKNQ